MDGQKLHEIFREQCEVAGARDVKAWDELLPGHKVIWDKTASAFRELVVDLSSE